MATNPTLIAMEATTTDRVDGVLEPLRAELATPNHAPRRKGLRRALPVDTILPLVAFVIIVVILTAWIG